MLLRYKRIGLLVLISLYLSLLLIGCGDSSGDTPAGASALAESSAGEASAGEANAKDAAKDAGSQAEESKEKGSRDNTPQVLVPETDGDDQAGNDLVKLDYTQSKKGYIGVKYFGDADKIKLLLMVPGDADTQYTYDITVDDGWVIVPLTGGDGSYTFDVYEHVVDKKYAEIYTESRDISLEDEFLPFLYPNQYVWFTKDSETVAKAQELAAGAGDDLDVVASVYDFVIGNVTYDDAKAEQATSGELKGYLPDVDEVLESGEGICFDYADLMAAMLRSQGIPTKLQIGYSGDTYHAWISIWTEETGWVENVINFDGEEWTLVDPTLAANNQAAAVKKYIGDGSHYKVMYSR